MQFDLLESSRPIAERSMCLETEEGAVTAERQMEFLVIRYVPRATNSRHLDIGVLVFEKTNGIITFADARFISDVAAVLAIDPYADIDMLQSCLRDFEKKLRDPGDRDGFIRMMRDTFSNVFQFSDPKAVIMSAKLEGDIDDLASVYLSYSRDN
jgi:hypothetical protein